MATSKKPRAIETGQGHSTGANRAAASRAKPKPEAWAKAVDNYWNPKVKIGGVKLPGSRLRYPKSDPKKNLVTNFVTSKNRREKAMDKQHNRYSK